jgi:hypothetical protein
MVIPKDKDLYNVIQKRVYKMYPKHSAYRSGILVQKYKKEFKKKYPKQKPYVGKKPSTVGLARWFKEDWKSDTGKYRYTSKSSVYRPTRRVTKKTPKTFGELTQKQIQKAKYKKYKYGRVDIFT